MKIIDVHAHLDFDNYKDDIDKVISENEKAGVVAVVNNGTTITGNRRTLELSKKYDIIKPAFGIYPTHVEEMSDEELEAEIAWIKEHKPIAIGEVGLDYKEGKNSDKQKKYFKKFIALARELDVPIIVHSRKAEEDVLDILDELGYEKVVLHCFSGRKHLVQRAIEKGWFFSIPAIVNKLEHFRNVVEKADISKLLTETDSPYLTPYPNIRRNEPRFIIESLQEIAKLKKMDVEEVSNNIFMNFQQLFM